jgi:hypothetical protein
MIEQASLLSEALWDWVAQHPPAAPRRVMWLDECDERWGLIVWLDLEPAPRGVNFLSPKFSANFNSHLHTEHKEAFFNAAYQIYFKRPAKTPALAVLHRSRCVMIFDRVQKVAFVQTLDETRGLDEGIRKKMIEWCDKPDGPFLIIDLPKGYGELPAGE